MSEPPAGEPDVVVRAAGPEDAAELTRLRAVMLASLAAPDPGALRLDEEWADLCRAELAAQLATGQTLVAMVVDAPDGAGLAAAGVGVIDLRLPAPGRLSTSVGHISSMCTDPQWRRRGYGAAVLDAIVVWLRERGCSRVELAASDDGLPLYQANGFVEAPNPSLRRRLD